MALDISTFFMKLGFTDILIWLLSFAIVYGVLSMINVPKDSKESQAIIGIVVGLLVMLAAPTTRLATFLANYAVGLVLATFGLIMLIVFFEVLGLKSARKREYRVGGKVVHTETAGFMSFLSAHPTLFTIALLVIAGLIFVGAGGLDLLGVRIPVGVNPMGALFFVLVIVAILWMVFSK